MPLAQALVALLAIGILSRVRAGPSADLANFLSQKHQPSAPPDGVVVVDYELELVNILALDELKQTMRVLVYVVQEWDDKSLSWDPAEFSNLTMMWLPVTAVWVPDIIVFNMLEHSEILKAVRTPVKIDHTGRIIFSYPAIYTVMCPIKINYFPFDDQTCALKVASWGYDKEKLLLNASKKAHLEHYLCNEEWALTHISISKATYEHEGLIVSEVEYNIGVSRKPLFYMITLVLPSYIICALSIAGLFARFSTKGEKEERFTLGVTAILTMAVLSLVVAEKVPHSSDAIPIMVIYFHFNIIIVTIATLFTSAVMSIHWKGLRTKESPPNWALKFFLIKRADESDDEDDVNHINSANCKDDTSEIAEARRVRITEWHRLSRRLDHLFFFCFMSIITIPTVVMFMHNQKRMSEQPVPFIGSCKG